MRRFIPTALVRAYTASATTREQPIGAGSRIASTVLVVPTSTDDSYDGGKTTIEMGDGAGASSRPLPLPPQTVAIPKAVGPLPKTARIAIIGGGPAGMAMARELSSLGYSATLFEAGPDVGGRAYTARDPKGRHHDMGAVAGVPYVYDVMREISDEVGVQRSDIPQRPTVELDDGEGARRIDVHPGVTAKARRYYQAAKYLALHAHYGSGCEGGSLEGVRPDMLRTTWAEYVKAHGLEEFERDTAEGILGFGYYDTQRLDEGCNGDVPAAYVLNYITPKMIAGGTLTRGSGLYSWDDGVQAVWQKLASNLEHAAAPVTIHRNTKVEGVVRDADGVHIQHPRSAEPETFDRLVVACHPGDALEFLDVNDAERRRFGAFQCADYRTYLCELEGAEDWRYEGAGYLVNRCDGQHMGQPSMWSNRYGDEFFVFYVPNAGSDDATVRANLAATAQKMGGALKQIHAEFRPKMFPHVRTGEAAEVLPAMFNAQGEKHTFVVGGGLAFDILPAVIKQAQETARRLVANKEVGSSRIPSVPSDLTDTMLGVE